MIDLSTLLTHCDPHTGLLRGAVPLTRRLSDLRGCFADAAAYTAALAQGDPLVYSVTSAEPAEGPGALHYGVGRIEPGRVGDEYHLTKGHLHAWRDAAELYFGLAGAGLMLLQDEDGGAARAVPLEPGAAVYVPGRTAHRTVNTGTGPLVYLGVYPAAAGHDYGALAEHNFRQVVLAGPDGPRLLERAELGAQVPA